jgi:hypothetical protein
MTVVWIEEYHCYQLHVKFYPISFSKLSPHVDEIIRDQQCGSRHNTSTTDHFFCIRQILEKKWKYNETVHQLQRKPMIQLGGEYCAILS